MHCSGRYNLVSYTRFNSRDKILQVPSDIPDEKTKASLNISFLFIFFPTFSTFDLFLLLFLCVYIIFSQLNVVRNQKKKNQHIFIHISLKCSDHVIIHVDHSPLCLMNFHLQTYITLSHLTSFLIVYAPWVECSRVC